MYPDDNDRSKDEGLDVDVDVDVQANNRDKSFEVSVILNKMKTETKMNLFSILYRSSSNEKYTVTVRKGVLTFAV